MDAFSVIQIDHVELFVPDRYEAADWYGRVLGLRIIPEFEHWAENPAGPLMVSSGAGTKLALFTGEAQGARPTAGFHRVAFQVDADGFVAFVGRLDGQQLSDDRGRAVTAASVVDHGRAYSIYFCDPYGHRLEVTTYDYEATRAHLPQDASRR